MRATRKASKSTKAPEDTGADVNEIVAYNFRAARELRGWTQEETARQLEDAGVQSSARRQSYWERRNEMLLALLDRDASRLDKAADELGAFFDHLRRVGIRGFVAEHVYPDPIADEVTIEPAKRSSRSKRNQD